MHLKFSCFKVIKQNILLPCLSCYHQKSMIKKDRKICNKVKSVFKLEHDENIKDFTTSKKYTIPSNAISKLNRASHIRSDPEKITELYNSRDSVLIPWHEGKFLFSTSNGNAIIKNKIINNDLKPLLLKPCNLYTNIINENIGYVFLGIHVETNMAIFASSIKREYINKLKDEMDGEWLELKKMRKWISEMYLETLVTAQGLLIWHHNNLYSGKTGNLIESIDGGHARRDYVNDDDYRNIFPRIDPAVIGLVVCTDDDYCLLGRKVLWKEKRYSLLSGFVEVGETLEMALYREVLEESNVKIDMESIVYKGNQSWPYPQTIMIGYHAKASKDVIKTTNINLSDDALLAVKESGIKEEEINKYLKNNEELPEIKVQEKELEDIKWFHCDYINAVLNNKIEEITLPDNNALSRQLLNQWIGGKMKNKKKWDGDDIVDYEIDDGTFKYVMMRIFDVYGNSKLIIRGNKYKTYHRNILESMDALIEDKKLKINCLGGGRMHHDPVKRTLFIYGYSSEFGAAVHEVTACMSRIWLPLYHKTNINVSYDGY